MTLQLNPGTREFALHDLRNRMKLLEQTTQVRDYLRIKDLLYMLEGGEMPELPFPTTGTVVDDGNGLHTKTKKKTSTGRKNGIMYENIGNVALETLTVHDAGDPGASFAFETLVESAAEAYEVKVGNTKTYKHFRTCFYAAMNTKRPEVESGGERGKRTYKLVKP